MSASVVAQDDTLKRSAVRPCHTVAPHQQVPSREQPHDFPRIGRLPGKRPSKPREQRGRRAWRDRTLRQRLEIARSALRRLLERR